MTKCCNYNCNQGDDCPYREEMPLTSIEKFSYWFLIVMSLGISTALIGIVAGVIYSLIGASK